MSGGDFRSVLSELAAVLEAQRIRYFVAGSLASVMHGELRTTQDADLVVDLPAEKVAALVAALDRAFFVDAELVRDAVARRSSCNLIHRQTALKVDLFVCRERAFSRGEMQRADEAEVLGLTLRVATVEDCVLAKLEWFRKGGEVSDRQWRDVLGMLKLQPRLDLAYLRTWAGDLGVDDLLQRALHQAGRDTP